MTHASTSAADLPGIARALLDERRDRDLMIRDGIFADPAWELILAVYVGQCEGLPRDALALEEWGRAPASTIGRWIRLLVEHRLFETSRNPDGMAITLAPATFIRLEAHLRALANALARVRGIG